MTATITGVRHELAFAQTLYYTGYDFEQATETEDMDGFDYLVLLDNDKYLLVDVKASSNSFMRGKPKKGRFKIRKDTVVEIASLAATEDFNGNMLLPEHIAAEKAPVLHALLTFLGQKEDITYYWDKEST